MTGLDTDPVELGSAADRIAEQARRVRERADALTCHDTPRASFRQALCAASGRLHDHADELDALADRLRTAATDYERTDADAAAAFGEIADGLR